MTGRAVDLAYWINARENMRVLKEKYPDAPPPFSGDPDMANVRYCNVHREDDKVTRWIAKHWRNPNANRPNLTLAMVAARMINWPDTLADIQYPFTEYEIWTRTAKASIRNRQIDGLKVWTAAYTISTCGRSMPKEDYVFDHVLAQVSTRAWEYVEGTKLSDAHRALMSVDGLGSFLAAQVVADLKNTPGHPLEKASDFWSWSAPGPGSMRGLEAYFGRKVTPSTYQHDIRLCAGEVEGMIHPSVGHIHMQDFQNCLCEFSKYAKFKEGGHVRNRYPPR